MNFCVLDEKSEYRPVYFYDMDDKLNTTGKRIKYLRETINNWNKGTDFLREVKRQTGEVVKSSALTNHENDTSMPKYETLKNYARVLGTTTDFLLLLTDDATPTKKTDRNIVIEAKGEEERRILGELAEMLEETGVSDLRLILDVMRRIVAVPAVFTVNSDDEITYLLNWVLDAIQGVGGKAMHDKALDELERSLPQNSPFAATWRRLRPQRSNKPL